MDAKKVFLLLCAVAVTCLPHPSHGAQGDITVDFGGLCPSVTNPAPFDFVVAPATEFVCQSGGTIYFKIKDSAGGNARIDATDPSPGNLDTLRLIEAQIYAVTPTPADRPQGYEITFWREHVSGPDTTDPNPDIYYKTTVSGSIKGVSGNWIKMDPGYVTNPVGGSETTLGTAKTYNVPCTMACNPSYNLTGLSTSGKWPDPPGGPNYLAGNRVLRTKFSFKLQNGDSTPADGTESGDWIVISAGGAKINAQTSADPGDLSECTDQYCSCPSCTKVIFITTTDASSWTKMTIERIFRGEKQAKIDAFTKIAWDSLSQDMAQGGGEYLTSLATLLDVPKEQRSMFFGLAQEQYSLSGRAGAAKRPEFLSGLQQALATHPTLAAFALLPVN